MDKMDNLKIVGISLAGNSGHLLLWTAFTKSNDDWLKFEIELVSSWYKANIEVEASLKNINEFQYGLTRLSRLEISDVEFSSEYGHFSIHLVRQKTGQIQVEGKLSDSLSCDNELDYYFMTYLSDVDSFLNQLRKLTDKYP